MQFHRAAQSHSFRCFNFELGNGDATSCLNLEERAPNAWPPQRAMNETQVTVQIAVEGLTRDRIIAEHASILVQSRFTKNRIDATGANTVASEETNS